MPLLETLQDVLPDALTGETGGEDDDESTEEDPDDEQEQEEDNSSGGFMSGGEETEEDLREDIEDLEYELDELRSELENTQSSMESMETKHEELEDDMEHVNGRIRKVLGIYEQFVEDKNPFQGNNTPELDTGDPDAHATANNTDDTDTSTDDTDSSDDTELTVEDLQKKAGIDPEKSTEQDDDPDQNVEESSGKFEGVLDDETYLTKPPLTYAGEVVAFEWLAHLMGESGSAGALKAMDFYENLGWLSPEVRDYMITLLSAPAVDVNAETQSPEELSSETHKESFRYIMKMSSVNREYVKEQSVRNQK